MVAGSRLAFAQHLADIADEVSGAYVSAAIQRISTKGDGTTETAVDRAVEERLLAMVAAEYPTDGFMGEEVGDARDGEPTWMVDGIDGTAALVARRPEWATLIGLIEAGRLSLGVASSPALGRRWWADVGRGAWTKVTGGDATASPERLQVSGPNVAGPPRIGMWPPAERVAIDYRTAAVALERRFGCDRPMPWAAEDGRLRPSWGSGVACGALLVASGRLDAFVLFGGGSWDLAATAVIVEEAGGRFSDDTGGRHLDRGVGVFSNALVHPAVLDGLRQAE